MGRKFTRSPSLARTSRQALEWLADELGARDASPARSPLAPPSPATGAITPEALAMSIAALLPDQAIVIDEFDHDRPLLLPSLARQSAA